MWDLRVCRLMIYDKYIYIYIIIIVIIHTHSKNILIYEIKIVRKFRSHTTRSMEQHVKISSGLVDQNINGGNFNLAK